MGKVLQVRVMAYTFDPDEVKEAWPNLHALVWGDASQHPAAPCGVLELVRGLDDGCRFVPWDAQTKTLLEAGVAGVVNLVRLLEEALGNWDPTQANRLTNQLEEALAELEQKLVTA